MKATVDRLFSILVASYQVAILGGTVVLALASTFIAADPAMVLNWALLVAGLLLLGLGDVAGQLDTRARLLARRSRRSGVKAKHGRIALAPTTLKSAVVGCWICAALAVPVVLVLRSHDRATVQITVAPLRKTYVLGERVHVAYRCVGTNTLCLADDQSGGLLDTSSPGPHRFIAIGIASAAEWSTTVRPYRVRFAVCRSKKLGTARNTAQTRFDLCDAAGASIRPLPRAVVDLPLSLGAVHRGIDGYVLSVRKSVAEPVPVLIGADALPYMIRLSP